MPFACKTCALQILWTPCTTSARPARRHTTSTAGCSAGARRWRPEASRPQPPLQNRLCRPRHSFPAASAAPPRPRAPAGDPPSPAARPAPAAGSATSRASWARPPTPTWPSSRASWASLTAATARATAAPRRRWPSGSAPPSSSSSTAGPSPGGAGGPLRLSLPSPAADTPRLKPPLLSFLSLPPTAQRRRPRPRLPQDGPQAARRRSHLQPRRQPRPHAAPQGVCRLGQPPLFAPSPSQPPPACFLPGQHPLSRRSRLPDTRPRPALTTNHLTPLSPRPAAPRGRVRARRRAPRPLRQHAPAPPDAPARRGPRRHRRVRRPVRRRRRADIIRAAPLLPPAFADPAPAAGERRRRTRSDSTKPRRLPRRRLPRRAGSRSSWGPTLT